MKSSRNRIPTLRKVFLLALLTFLGSQSAAAAAAPSEKGDPSAVTMPNGAVLTGSRVAEQGNLFPYSAYRYLGIRYATAKRFADPVLAPPVSGSYVQPGAICPQVNAAFKAIGEEDCLFLNVWKPWRAEPDSALPVLFYIHGGAFIEGSSTSGLNQQLLFDGLELSNLGGNGLPPQGMIVVTINYRLGPLGFLTHSDSTGRLAGNFGFRDQVTALAWVQQNIAAFGGDPKKVTLAGESAGAISVGYHAYSSTVSAGLFDGLIMESNTLGLPLASEKDAGAVGELLFGNLDCDNKVATVACIRDPAKMSYQELAKTGVLVYFGEALQGANLLPFSPHLDRQLLTRQPLEGAKSAPNLPTLLGTNLDEGALFLALSQGKVEKEQYLGLLHGLFGVTKESDFTPPLPQAYQCSSQASCGSQYARVITDYIFTCASHALAETLVRQKAPGNPAVFAYQFRVIPSWDYPPTKDKLCAKAVCHAAEIPFVWNTAEAAGGAFDVAEEDLAQDMTRLWASMAVHGNPNLAYGTPIEVWPPYEEEGYLLINGFDKSRAYETARTLGANCESFWDLQGYPGIPKKVK